MRTFQNDCDIAMKQSNFKHGDKKKKQTNSFVYFLKFFSIFLAFYKAAMLSFF